MIGCLLDMDGVLADFVGAMVKAHGKEDPYKNGKHKGNFSMEEAWKMPLETFWKPANFVDFWASMKKTPEADDLVSFVEKKFGKENVAILTTQSEHPSSVIGKIKWIDSNYPQFNRRLILTAAKDFLAHPENTLIDDKTENVDNFIKSGGLAVLMPRPWNREHRKSAFSLKHTIEAIGKLNIVKK